MSLSDEERKMAFGARMGELVAVIGCVMNRLDNVASIKRYVNSG